MKTPNNYAVPEAPDLRTHEAEIEGKKYLFTELNGLQRVTVDIESGIANASEEDKERAAVMWYDFKCYFVAMALEASTKKPWKELLPSLRAQRMETLLAMHDAALIASYGTEEDGSPKDESG